MTSPSSTTRWSTRPVSVITTISSRAGVNAMTSRCRTVEVDTGLQKTLDGTPLCGRQWFDVVKPVDELAVALFRRYPTGAGVRLSDVALGLEDGHIVAHRRGRDAEIMPVPQRLRADRFLGGDEVGDDRAQHLKAALVGSCHPDRPSYP